MNNAERWRARWLIGAFALTLGVAAFGGADGVSAASTPTAVTRAPSVTGITPKFDKPVSRTHGFTVNVRNYTSEYAWSATSDVGKVRTGAPSGKTWSIKVTGLRPGQSALVEVRADMPGLESNPVTVRGRARSS